jgi:PPOX class probable F420-dependent enzyme
MSFALDDAARAFLEQARVAAMTTLRRDGTPHTVRIGIAVVDGKIWSSGTQARARTRHLRRDPRASLFVVDAGYGYLTLDCTVRILDGPDVPELSVKLFETMQRGMERTTGTVVWYGAEKTIDEFQRIMREEQRLIYEFEPLRAYGLYQAGGR